MHWVPARVKKSVLQGGPRFALPLRAVIVMDNVLDISGERRPKQRRNRSKWSPTSAKQSDILRTASNPKIHDPNLWLPGATT